MWVFGIVFVSGAFAEVIDLMLRGDAAKNGFEGTDEILQRNYDNFGKKENSLGLVYAGMDFRLLRN